MGKIALKSQVTVAGYRDSFGREALFLNAFRGIETFLAYFAFALAILLSAFHAHKQVGFKLIGQVQLIFEGYSLQFVFHA